MVLTRRVPLKIEGRASPLEEKEVTLDFRLSRPLYMLWTGFVAGSVPPNTQAKKHQEVSL